MKYSQRRKVISVIGDSNLAPDDVRLQLAHQIGRLLVDRGFTVMTGGMGGVMHAALQGGRSSAAWVPGCCIGMIPGTDPDDGSVSEAADLIIPTGLDHARNLIVAQSDGVIAVGGGAGTLSEIALAWIHRRLLIALRCDGWSGRLADQRIDGRRRYPEIESDRVYGADTADEAVALVELHCMTYGKRHRGIARRQPL
ncbi:MAG: LOG family protein [Roseovarius sp.]|nr:LOG family protein [Roseovarius sp.]